MGRLRCTRIGAMGMLLLASSTGLTASPADAVERVTGARHVTSGIGAPRAVVTAVTGRDVAVRWRAPARADGVGRYEMRYRQAGQSRWSTSISASKRLATIRDLVGGRRAYFTVRARDDGRAGAWSTPVAAMPISRPSAVRSTAVATPDHSVRLTWRAPARSGGRSIEHYEIKYRAQGSTKWHSLRREVRQATIIGLRNTTKYSFKVRAGNAVGPGPWTKVLIAKPGTKAAARTTYAQSATSARRASAVLFAPASVEVGTPGAAASANETFESSTPVAAVPLTASSADDGAAEWMRVPAVDDGQTSPRDVVASPTDVVLTSDVLPSTAATPEQPSTEPIPSAVSAPPGLIADLAGAARAGAVSLAWTAPASGGRFDRFEVRARLEGALEWRTIGTTTASTTISDLEDGVPTDFSVRAVGDDAGAWSAAVIVTPGTPTAPRAAGVRFAGRSLAVDTTWSAESVAANGAAVTGWEVRYRAAGDDAWTTDEVIEPTAATARTDTLAGGFDYQFSVRARNARGAGEWAESSTLYVPVLTLPVLSVDTAASAPIVSKDEYMTATYSLDPNGAVASTGESYPAATGSTDIRGRGNSTWIAAKKPYRLKLALKTALLGMPSNKNWVLLANAYDHSSLRNDTALYLGTKTGLAWTPRTRYVEVLLNGHYLGLYQLAEQVRIDTGRIDIKSMKSTDTSGAALTGGYQLERDGRWDPNWAPGFWSSMQQPITIADPEAPTSEQSRYIKEYFNDFETALQSSSRGDPVAGYAKYIDVDSFVDWYIVEEYTQNVDANFASVDLYKPRSGKLTMGPLWDFDLSLENDARLYGRRHEWYVKNESWWRELFKDPAWEQRVEVRWHVLRQSLADVNAHVDATQAAIATAAVGDSRRWGGYGDHDIQIDIVRDFLTDRASWLDLQWGKG